MICFGASAGAVAQSGQIGNESDEPEQKRNGEVGGDREDVPDQRTAKLRPIPHRIGIRKQPIGEPRTSEVEHRKHPRAEHGENGHGFGGAVDGRAPLLMQQQQNRGDQRAGVADPDPPDEIHDGEAPSDGDVYAPNPHANGEEDGDRIEKHQQQQKGDGESQKPSGPPSLAENDRADLVGDGRDRVARVRSPVAGLISAAPSRGSEFHVDCPSEEMTSELSGNKDALPSPQIRCCLSISPRPRANTAKELIGSRGGLYPWNTGESFRPIL